MQNQPQDIESGRNPALTSPEAVARRLIDEGFTLGRLEVADELIADDLAEHQDYGPSHAAGPAGVKAVIASLHRAFPDFRLTIQDLWVAGDTVWTRNVATGTHDGPFLGYAATGRSMQITVFDVLRVAGGKVVEHWGVPDRLGALVQIGAVRLPSRRDSQGDGPHSTLG
jgi:predicted ester cyclase